MKNWKESEACGKAAQSCVRDSMHGIFIRIHSPPREVVQPNSKRLSRPSLYPPDTRAQNGPTTNSHLNTCDCCFHKSLDPFFQQLLKQKSPTNTCFYLLKLSVPCPTPNLDLATLTSYPYKSITQQVFQHSNEALVLYNR